MALILSILIGVITIALAFPLRNQTLAKYSMLLALLGVFLWPSSAMILSSIRSLSEVRSENSLASPQEGMVSPGEAQRAPISVYFGTKGHSIWLTYDREGPNLHYVFYYPVSYSRIRLELKMQSKLRGRTKAQLN